MITEFLLLLGALQYLETTLVLETSSFPTYVLGERVTIYTDKLTFQIKFTIDIFENDQRKQKILQNLKDKPENKTLAKLLDLLTWLTNLIDSLPIYNRQTLPDVQQTFTWGTEIESLLTNRNRIRRQLRIGSPVYRSIGRNNELLDVSKVVGCPKKFTYNRNQITCLKKFLLLIKEPIGLFVGDDLLLPLLAIAQKPISPLTSRDIREFSDALGFDRSEVNSHEIFQSELVDKIEVIPSPEYITVTKRLRPQDSVDQEETSSITSLESMTDLLNKITYLQTRNDQLDTEITNLQAENDQLEALSSNTPKTMEKPESSPTNNPDNLETLRPPTETHDTTYTDQVKPFTILYNLPQSSFQPLDKQLPTLPPTNKMTTDSIFDLINTQHNPPDTASESNLDLYRRITDNANTISRLKSELGQLKRDVEKLEVKDVNTEKTLTDLLTTLENLRDKLRLTKTSLQDSQTQFMKKLTDLDNKLEDLSTNDWRSEVDNLEQEIQSIKEGLIRLSTESRTNTDDDDLEILMSERVWLPLIKQIQQITVLLTSPRQSSYFPFNLLLKRTLTVELYRTKENDVIIEIEYLDNKQEMVEIVPLTLCSTRNDCFIYVPQGFGTTNQFFNKDHCDQILLNTYFCSKSFTEINCPTYLESCSPWEKQIPIYEPLQKNLTHVFWFPLTDEKLQDTLLESKSNYLVTVKHATKITIQGFQFKLLENGLENDIIYKLRIKKDHVIVAFWMKYWDNILMVLGSLVLTFSLTGITFYIIKRERNQPDNNQRRVRVNASRVYYRAPRSNQSN